MTLASKSLGEMWEDLFWLRKPEMENSLSELMLVLCTAIKS